MANPSSENRITCQLCYGQNGEHQKGCAMNQRSIPPSSNQQLNGTFECPVCGKDSPHQHAANTIRWYSDHLDRFMLAVNGGEPKESFDWGGTYPNPERPDEPPRFRHQPYQSLWESYCCFVRAGLIPARLAVETAATPTRHQWVKTPRGWDCRGCGSFAASNSGRDFIDLDYPCRPALKASGVACCPHRIALDDECHECGAVNGTGNQT